MENLKNKITGINKEIENIKKFSADVEQGEKEIAILKIIEKSFNDNEKTISENPDIKNWSGHICDFIDDLFDCIADKKIPVRHENTFIMFTKIFGTETAEDIIKIIKN